MIDPSFEIRSATRDELPETVACVVAAFITDPLARYACASPHEYLRGMPSMVEEFAGGAFDHGSAYVSVDFCGAALWLPPGVHPDDEKLERAFREAVKPERLDDLLGTFEQMGQSHPEEPHWYLPMIGVEPNAQSRGIGSALMQHALQSLRPGRRAGLPRVVESSQHRALRTPRLRGAGADPGRRGAGGHAHAEATATTLTRSTPQESPRDNALSRSVESLASDRLAPRGAGSSLRACAARRSSPPRRSPTPRRRPPARCPRSRTTAS